MELVISKIPSTYFGLEDYPPFTPSHSNRLDQRAPNGTTSFKINERPLDQVFYSLDFTFGTPPQDLVLAIQPLCPVSTWVASRNANFTNETLFGYPNANNRPYVFDSNASSTAQDSSESIDFTYYSPYTFGSGGYIIDNLSISGVPLGRRDIVLLTEGYRSPGDICLDDISMWLKNTSKIDEEVFSIWLNGPDSAPGDILFGGVDTEKFQDSVVLLPALTALDFLGEDTNVFNLESMTISNGSGNVDLLQSHPNVSFELDYGTFGSLFPPHVSESIYEILGGHQPIQDDRDVPGVLVPCSAAQRSLSINFTFGYETAHTLISVPISELMSGPELTSSALNSSKIVSPNSTKLCLFNILPATDNNYLVLNHSVFHLGASALKSVYTVFDKGTRSIGVGNAKANVTISNFVNYNHGCFSGVRFIESSLSSACVTTTTQYALPTSLFTDSPTTASASSIDATASPTSTKTSMAAKCNAYTLLMMLATALPLCLCPF